MDNMKINCSNQPIAFEILPHEIHLKIFSFLDKIELHMTAALVSKKWLYVSRDPSLTKEVVLGAFGDYTARRSEQIISMLSRATMLKDLSIYNRKDVNILLQTMAQFSGRQLEKLSISECKSLTEECTLSLQENCTNLKSLEIFGYEWKKWNWTVSDIAISHLTKIHTLENLWLDQCKYMLPHHIKDIAQNCYNLQSVYLWDMKKHPFNEESIDKLLCLRKGTLKILNLYSRGTYLSVNAFSNVSACNNLEELEIRVPSARSLRPLVKKKVSKLTKLKQCIVQTMEEFELELDEQFKCIQCNNSMSMCTC